MHSYRRICHGHNSKRGICGECPVVSSLRKRPLASTSKIARKFKRKIISGAPRGIEEERRMDTHGNDENMDVDAPAVDDGAESLNDNNDDNDDAVPDEDVHESDAEPLSVFLFEAVVGYQFDTKPSETGSGTDQKFIMQTINEDTKECHRNVYESGQIKVGFMFDDGPVKYFDDTIPKLDRESLGWNASLVNKSIKSTWMVRRLKTFFTGKVVSYNDESQKHTVKWEDDTTNEFDVMGRWHADMLPIIEWRLLCEDELPAPANKELSSRGKRVASKELRASNTDSRSASRSCVTIPSAKRAKQGQRDKCRIQIRGQKGVTKKGRVAAPAVPKYNEETPLPALSKNIARMDEATCEREKKRAWLLTRVKQNLCCLSPEAWLDDNIIEYCLMTGCDRIFKDSLGAPPVLKEWDRRDHINSTGSSKDILDFGVLSSFLITVIEENATCYEKGVMPPHLSADKSQWHIFCGPDKLCQFLLFPINFKNRHWSLGIVWQERNVILYLDSSDVIDDKCVEAKCGAIRIYLNSLSSKKFTKESLPLLRVKVPQQKNGYDCGMFLLHHAMLFITSGSKHNLACDLLLGKKEKWFEEKHLCKLRKRLLKVMTLRSQGLPEENEARLNGASISEKVRQKIHQEKVWGSNVAHAIQPEDSESGSDEDSMLKNDELMQKLEDGLRKRIVNGENKKPRKKEGGSKYGSK